MTLSTEDRYEIRQLYARYAWARSTADIDAFVELFASEGVTISDEGAEFAGPTAAHDYMDEWMHRPGSAGQQYWIMQQVLESDGADRCLVRAFLMTPMLNPIGTPSMVFYRYGYLTDRLVKRDGRWRLLEHVIELWRGEVLSGFPGGPPEAWDLAVSTGGAK